MNKVFSAIMALCVCLTVALTIAGCNLGNSGAESDVSSDSVFANQNASLTGGNLSGSESEKSPSKAEQNSVSKLDGSVLISGGDQSESQFAVDSSDGEQMNSNSGATTENSESKTTENSGDAETENSESTTSSASISAEESSSAPTSDNDGWGAYIKF